jgi:hypothetical protein
MRLFSPGRGNLLKCSLSFPRSVYPRANVAEFGESEGVPANLAQKVMRMEGAHYVSFQWDRDLTVDVPRSWN